MTKTHGLSKSKLMSYRQCPKRLWQEVHEPLDEEGAPSLPIINGNHLGIVARDLYRPGALMSQPGDEGLQVALARTAEAMKDRTGTLFEATFCEQGVLVMCDVLKRRRGATQLVEVKSAGKVKPQYVDDIAIQAHVVQQAGIALNRVSIAHVNTTFEYLGDGDYAGLLTEVRMEPDLREVRDQVADWVKGARKTLAGRKPKIEPGAQCDTPYACPFKERCMPAADGYPISILPRIRQPAIDEYHAQGITDVRQIDPAAVENAQHRMVIRASRSGRAVIDRAALRELQGASFPRFYLDFETIGTAVPLWPRTRPYQALPFQWSLHIETRDGSLAHREFLDVSGEAPMRAWLEALIDAVGKCGAIHVYSGFESRILADMAKRFPDCAKAIDSIRTRIVDLLPITRRGYYHPRMMGSWSIKAVLPTIGKAPRYAELGEVQDGEGAQLAFLEAINPGTAAARREAIAECLRRYCALDTLAMVHLRRHLAAKL